MPNVGAGPADAADGIGLMLENALLQEDVLNDQESPDDGSGGATVAPHEPEPEV